MAKLNIYKDSIGRCEPSSMLYDAVRYPNAFGRGQKKEISTALLSSKLATQTSSGDFMLSLQKIVRPILPALKSIWALIKYVLVFCMSIVILPVSLGLRLAQRWILSPVYALFCAAVKQLARVSRACVKPCALICARLQPHLARMLNLVLGVPKRFLAIILRWSVPLLKPAGLICVKGAKALSIIFIPLKYFIKLLVVMLGLIMSLFLDSLKEVYKINNFLLLKCGVSHDKKN